MKICARRLPQAVSHRLVRVAGVRSGMPYYDLAEVEELRPMVDLIGTSVCNQAIKINDNNRARVIVNDGPPTCLVCVRNAGDFWIALSR